MQNTDKLNTDNSHCHVCAEHKRNRDNSHRHVVCAAHRQTEHRQFSLSCVRRTQTEHGQFSPSCCVCRTQTNRTETIVTVRLCVQNTNRTQTILTIILCVQNTDNSHCNFVRAEHSWAVTWTRPSAVPTTPCGNCSSRTERGTSTVCDTAAYWSVGADPSRLVWHQDGQTLTQ